MDKRLKRKVYPPIRPVFYDYDLGAILYRILRIEDEEEQWGEAAAEGWEELPRYAQDTFRSYAVKFVAEVLADADGTQRFLQIFAENGAVTQLHQRYDAHKRRQRKLWAEMTEQERADAFEKRRIYKWRKNSGGKADHSDGRQEEQTNS